MNATRVLQWAQALGFPAAFSLVLLWALLVTLPQATRELATAIKESAAEQRAALLAVHHDVRRLLEERR